MTYHALLEYIQSAKECGASDEEITEQLSDAGWYRVDIQDALSLHEKLSERAHDSTCDPEPVAPRPSWSERLIPHTYDPHLVAVAALSFVLGFLGYLLIR